VSCVRQLHELSGFDYLRKVELKIPTSGVGFRYTVRSTAAVYVVFGDDTHLDPRIVVVSGPDIELGLHFELIFVIGCLLAKRSTANIQATPVTRKSTSIPITMSPRFIIGYLEH
jgi:hypothetical protein